MIDKKIIKVIQVNSSDVPNLSDRISIEFSPLDLERLAYIFEQRAIKADAYPVMAEELECRKTFVDAISKYTITREELKNDR